MATLRQQRIAKALTALIPKAPFIDAEQIRARARAPHLRDRAPETALWLTTIAYIRHEYSDYDRMMDEGYGTEAARHFAIDDINRILEEWGSTRHLSAQDEDLEDASPL